MILVDTNILIYSAQPLNKHLRMIFKQKNVGISIISKLEVLGYHKITRQQINYFNTIFQLVTIFPITEEIINHAIDYRQKKSMSVADSIIAATAKLNGCDLYTNNVADFKSINDFEIMNPLWTK